MIIQPDVVLDAAQEQLCRLAGPNKKDWIAPNTGPVKDFCHNKARKAEEKEGKDSQESNEEPARGIANVGQVDQRG